MNSGSVNNNRQVSFDVEPVRSWSGWLGNLFGKNFEIQSIYDRTSKQFTCESSTLKDILDKNKLQNAKPAILSSFARLENGIKKKILMLKAHEQKQDFTDQLTAINTKITSLHYTFDHELVKTCLDQLRKLDDWVDSDLINELDQARMERILIVDDLLKRLDKIPFLNNNDQLNDAKLVLRGLSGIKLLEIKKELLDGLGKIYETDKDSVDLLSKEFSTLNDFLKKISEAESEISEAEIGKYKQLYSSSLDNSGIGANLGDRTSSLEESKSNNESLSSNPQLLIFENNSSEVNGIEVPIGNSDDEEIKAFQTAFNDISESDSLSERDSLFTNNRLSLNLTENVSLQDCRLLAKELLDIKILEIANLSSQIKILESKLNFSGENIKGPVLLNLVNPHSFVMKLEECQLLFKTLEYRKNVLDTVMNLRYQLASEDSKEVFAWDPMLEMDEKTLKDLYSQGKYEEIMEFSKKFEDEDIQLRSFNESKNNLLKEIDRVKEELTPLLNQTPARERETGIPTKENNKQILTDLEKRFDFLSKLLKEQQKKRESNESTTLVEKSFLSPSQSAELITESKEGPVDQVNSNDVENIMDNTSENKEMKELSQQIEAFQSVLAPFEEYKKNHMGLFKPVKELNLDERTTRLEKLKWLARVVLKDEKKVIHQKISELNRRSEGLGINIKSIEFRNDIPNKKNMREDFSELHAENSAYLEKLEQLESQIKKEEDYRKSLDNLPSKRDTESLKDIHKLKQEYRSYLSSGETMPPDSDQLTVEVWKGLINEKKKNLTVSVYSPTGVNEVDKMKSKPTSSNIEVKPENGLNESSLKE